MGYKSMDNVIEQIKEIASKYKINKVLLFGSRARGDNSSTSDYDIAVFGHELSELDKARFSYDVDEIETLKKIDIVYVNKNVTDTLVKNIMRDGVTIYEQTGSKSK